MTEQIRGYFEILWDLFFKVGKKEAALEQYSLVRHTEHDMKRLLKYNLSTGSIPKKSLGEFQRRFLNGTSIGKASDSQLNEGLKTLRYAISACHERCERLTNELNDYLRQEGLGTVQIEKFLNFLTFSYRTRDNGYGFPVVDPEYYYEIRDFVDDDIRKKFRLKLKELKKVGKEVSMQDILAEIYPQKEWRGIIY